MAKTCWILSEGLAGTECIDRLALSSKTDAEIAG